MNWRSLLDPAGIGARRPGRRNISQGRAARLPGARGKGGGTRTFEAQGNRQTGDVGEHASITPLLSPRSDQQHFADDFRAAAPGTSAASVATAGCFDSFGGNDDAQHQ